MERRGLGCVGLDWVGLGRVWVALRWVWVGLRWVALGWVGLLGSIYPIHVTLVGIPGET